MSTVAGKNAGSRRYLKWDVLRWVLAAVLGAGIWIGVGQLAETSSRYAQTHRPEKAAEQLSCTQQTHVEVKNPDGTVRSAKSQESKVPCEPATPAPFPGWLKATLVIAGIALLALLVASGAVIEAIGLLLTVLFM